MAPKPAASGAFGLSDLAATPAAKGLPEGPTLGELIGGGYVEPVDQAPAPVEPALPPGVSLEDGVYYRAIKQDGQETRVPVGEKALEEPMYSPVDLLADVGSGGLMGLAKASGRSLLGGVAKQASPNLARLVGKEVVTNGGLGLLAGSAMEGTDQATGSKASALAAGLGAPLAAVLLPTAVRHGLMRAMQQAPGAVEKSLAVLPEGVRPATKSSLLGKLGTLSENIGEEAYGAVQRAEALQALAANRVQAETGQYTLRPWVQELLTHIPYLREDKALAVGQRVRDLVGRLPWVGEALAGRLGISPERLQRLTSLAEVIPDQPLDAAGLLRLGIRETIKDQDGRPMQAWRHGLDPLAAREELAALSPVEQKFLMAYVEPAEGWHLSPRLPAAGELAGEPVDPGLVATVKIMEALELGPAYLVGEFRSAGRKLWTGAFKAGGVDGHLVDLAADYLAPLARLKGHDLADALEVLAQTRAAAPYVKPGAPAPGQGASPSAALQEPMEALARQRGDKAAPKAAPTYGAELLRPRDSGAFVPAGNGGADMGAIGPEVSTSIGREAAPIRLRRGDEKTGELHIEMSHGGQIRQAGYSSARDLVEDVAANYSQVHKGRGLSLILVKPNGQNKMAFVELAPAADGAFWDVKSALISRQDYLKNKRLLWDGAQSRQPLAEPPSAISGRGNLFESSIGPGGGAVNTHGAPGGKRPLTNTPPPAQDWGNLAPEDNNQAPRLASQVGQAGADWRPSAPEPGEIPMPWTPRAPFQGPGTISREAAFRDLVEAGVLQPGQKLKGYVTHMGASAQAQAAAAEAARLNQTAPELSLQPMVPGFAKERLDNLGAAPRLDEAVTAYRTAAETTKLQRGLLRRIGPMLLEPVEPTVRHVGDGVQVVVPGNPAAKDLVRTRTEWSHWAGKEVTRQEPLSLVDIGPVEAEALGVSPGRHTIPTAFAERFDSLMGNIKSGKLDTPLTGLGELTRDLARYWKLNQLVAPGTAVTNLLGGLSQYASKVGEDVVRYGLTRPRRVLDDLAAPVRALSPSMVERLPAEILGGNVATQFGRDASQFYKGVQARLTAGEQVNLSSRALGALANLTMKTVSLGLKPFGAIENYLKRSIYLSEVMDLARREAAALKAQGVAVKPLDLVARMFQDQPELHRQVMQGAIDRFAYDYDNIPTGLKTFRDSTLGAMTVPYPVYGYKYGRAILNQANALNPLNHDLPLRERLARGAGGLLLPVAGFEAARRYMAGGESQAQNDLDKFQEKYGTAVDGEGNHVKVAYPKLDGREMIASGSDEQGQPHEDFLRTAKYGYLNLPKAFRSWGDFFGFLDEFKTTGPVVTLAMNAFGGDPRHGPRDFPGQVGQIVAGLIPAHRMLEFTASVSDDFKRRVPQGFWEQIMMAFPGGRDYIRQPMDKWAAKLAQDDASLEWLKFLSGINIKRAYKADAKEAMAEAVARAAEHTIKDTERLAVYSRLSGLTPEAIKPHLPTIRKMETTAEINYRQVERTVFGVALLRGLDAMDPAQATAIGKVKEKVGHEVVTKGLGMHNQHQARKGLRFAAGLAWINQNLGKGQGDGQ